MAHKLICVVGATGNQGDSVVSTFLKAKGWKIRGLTRNRNSPAAQALIARGVEMVNADLDDVTSLTTAFQEAYAIFSVLDFWTGFRNSANKSKLKEGQTMLEWAHDYELQQGKNVFAAAAQTQGLERLVFSALSYATKWSGGKYKHVYHFDAEGRAVEYGQLHYPDVMERTSVIQLGIYLSNMLLMPQYQPKKVRHTFLPMHVDPLLTLRRSVRTRTVSMCSRQSSPRSANFHWSQQMMIPDLL
jgi:hypothetical protein